MSKVNKSSEIDSGDDLFENDYISQDEYDSLLSYEGGDEFFENVLGGLAKIDNESDSSSDSSSSSSDSSSNFSDKDSNYDSEESPFVDMNLDDSDEDNIESPFVNVDGNNSVSDSDSDNKTSDKNSIKNKNSTDDDKSPLIDINIDESPLFDEVELIGGYKSNILDESSESPLIDGQAVDQDDSIDIKSLINDLIKTL